MKKTLTVLGLALVLNGCMVPLSQREKGGLAGGVLGGVVGAALGKNDPKAIGIGIAGGALAGVLIGNKSQEVEKIHKIERELEEVKQQQATQERNQERDLEPKLETSIPDIQNTALPPVPVEHDYWHSM